MVKLVTGVDGAKKGNITGSALEMVTSVRPPASKRPPDDDSKEEFDPLGTEDSNTGSGDLDKIEKGIGLGYGAFEAQQDEVDWIGEDDEEDAAAKKKDDLVVHGEDLPFPCLDGSAEDAVVVKAKKVLEAGKEEGLVVDGKEGLVDNGDDDDCSSEEDWHDANDDSDDALSKDFVLQALIDAFTNSEGFEKPNHFRGIIKELIQEAVSNQHPGDISSNSQNLPGESNTDESENKDSRKDLVQMVKDLLSDPRTLSRVLYILSLTAPLTLLVARNASRSRDDVTPTEKMIHYMGWEMALSFIWLTASYALLLISHFMKTSGSGPQLSVNFKRIVSILLALVSTTWFCLYTLHVPDLLFNNKYWWMTGSFIVITWLLSIFIGCMDVITEAAITELIWRWNMLHRAHGGLLRWNIHADNPCLTTKKKKLIWRWNTLHFARGDLLRWNTSCGDLSLFCALQKCNISIFLLWFLIVRLPCMLYLA